jgi:2-polyprenyl-3-methyl-5-hydroxy-6-metoxy-1,4-benzoquinol methylase
MNCFVCQNKTVSELGVAGIRPGSVASDSWPCPLPAVVHSCPHCGHLQKHHTAVTLAAINEIYRHYTPHHLAQGNEQVVFPEGLPPRPRTWHTLEKCRPNLPAQGRLLDVGCGNGAVLKSAGALLNGWELHGYDLNDKHRDDVLRLSGVASFTSGSLSKLPHSQFDLIVLWHTLEHIREPHGPLAELRDLLAPGGCLLVQVPDIERTPFDLAVIDHCSHFSRRTLATLCQQAGFEVALDGTSWIHNCVTLLLRKSESPAPAVTPADAATLAGARACFEWYNATVRKFDDATQIGDFAIFGAGMAGIALLTQLSRRPSCILDEDLHRAGRTLEEVPIIPPRRAAVRLRVILPFAPATAARIAARVRATVPVSAGWDFVMPAPLNANH